MKISLDYQKPLEEIVAEVLKMDEVLESQQADLMKQVGKEIQKEVRKILPKSSEEHRHMSEDVKVTVKGKKEGVSGVSVHGGKDTAYKWHMLDDGTRNPDGTVHTPAIHFTSKALQNASSRIEKLIDDMERKVVK